MTKLCLLLILICFSQQKRLVALENSNTTDELIKSEKYIIYETPLIKQIVIEGNSKFLDEDLNSITQKFLEQPATLSNLQEIARQVSQFYWDQGFLTSDAYPPLEQDISQGIIFIKVMEGELDKISIIDDSGKTIDNKSIKDFLRRRGGFPLNINNLLEGLKLLKTQHNVSKIESELQEGSLPKLSNLDLKIKQDSQFNIEVNADNYGAFNSGQEEGKFEFTANDLSGQGDKLVVNGVLSEGSEQALIDYQMPLCLIDCLSLQLHYEFGTSEVIRQPLETFDIEGEFQKFFIEISQPIIKSSQTDLRVDWEMGWQRSETFVLGRRFSFSPQSADGIYDVYTIRTGATWEEKWTTGALINRGEITIGADSLLETSDPFILLRLQSNWIEFSEKKN